METVPATLAPTTACIVGGGPAGMMLGLLLARAGIPVVVLEKHKDFFRDFRGDTIHPATLELIYQLGLLPALLDLPHQTVTQAGAMVGGQALPIADFTHLPTQAKYIALMPQWDLLNFLAREAGRYPSFRLLMEHEATGLIQRSGRVNGVTMMTPDGPATIEAALMIGCDGRHALTTEAAHLKVIETGAPIDVLWFRVTRHPSDPENALGVLNYGQMMVLINRGEYFQIGYIIRKGTFASGIQPAGLDAFRASLVRLSPFLADRVGELRDWSQIKLLTVQVNHLERWHVPGLLCIGDAAHAMSPVGGIGINLAIQDAVATANILTEHLLKAAKHGTVITNITVEKVQHRREFATRLTQRGQVAAHGMLNRILGDSKPMKPNWVLKLLSGSSLFRRLAGRMIGMGVLPERIRT